MFITMWLVREDNDDVIIVLELLSMVIGVYPL